MVKPRVAMVSDDFTGANDSAGRFAAHGWTPYSSAGLETGPGGADLHSLNAATRYLAPALAQKQSARAWSASKAAVWRFQKIDSTLRGWPGQETLGFIQARQPPLLMFCPAYPRFGRTVRGGRLLVHDRDLMRTEYARDPLSPARASKVQSLFPGGLAGSIPLAVVTKGVAAIRRRIQRLRSIGPVRVLVPDAVLPVHLRWLVRAALAEGIRDFTGASGLAEALASGLAGLEKRKAYSGPRKGLILAGTVSQTSLDQLARVEKSGHEWDSVDWPGRGLAAGSARLKRWKRALPEGLALSSLKRRGDIDRRRPAWTGSQRLKRLAAAAIALGATRGRLTALLTGGHCAEVFFEQAGLGGMWIRGELEPGLPYGVAVGKGRKAWVASKPGGFGDLGTFERFFAVLKNRN